MLRICYKSNALIITIIPAAVKSSPDSLFLLQISVEDKLDILFFTQLFVSKRKQIALMADENLIFSSSLRNRLLRNEDFVKISSLLDILLHLLL